MTSTGKVGPALVLGHWDWHWAHWVAPVLGACAAALLYHHVLLDAPFEPPVREEWLDAGGRR